MTNNMTKDLGKIVSIAAMSLYAAVLPARIDAHHAPDCVSEAKRIVGNILMADKQLPAVPSRKKVIVYMGGIDKRYHSRDYMECLVNGVTEETKGEYKATFTAEDPDNWIYIITKPQ